MNGLKVSAEVLRSRGLCAGRKPRAAGKTIHNTRLGRPGLLNENVRVERGCRAGGAQAGRATPAPALPSDRLAVW